ncbi:MAG: hypothetical protein M1835_001323 [Candelina submexicana]|nr:MAG: hypothetical protein M1835_001323 [Candelina submexicana]
MQSYTLEVVHLVTAPLRLGAQWARSSNANVRELLVGAAVACMASAIWISGDRFRSLLGDRVPPRASRVAFSRDLGTGQDFYLRFVLDQSLTLSIPDAAATDPGLLKKHSSFKSYTVPVHQITYPAIRTFYRPHPQADKLPLKPTPLPLLVFIHGLGGSLAQFHPLLASLVNLAPCLGVDLPGCGLSKFAPTAWGAYTTEALVGLLERVIDEHRDKDAGQGVVLIGHRCSLAVLLASGSLTGSTDTWRHVLGLVAVCPRATPPSKDSLPSIQRLLNIPTPIFNMWRRWDRRGGTESASVARFLGPDADQETKRLQLRFNEQSKTAVWRRMAFGCLPHYNDNGVAVGGLPGQEIWATLEIPIYLLAGAADRITTSAEVDKIALCLGKASHKDTSQGGGEVLSPTSVPPGDMGTDSPPPDPDAIKRTWSASTQTTSTSISSADKNSRGMPTLIPKSTSVQTQTTTYSGQERKLLRTTVLPSPAAHALLYTPASCRILAGLVSTFLSEHIDRRLSLGWQLQHLTTEGKWDVKNLAKWQAVTPVSEPIAGIFRAMKTLREIDDYHCPAKFVKEWRGQIRVVVDISHESPVYDPNGLETHGIGYHKFPTVSKIPPTVDEVRDFITLIDSLRAENCDSQSSESRNANQALIGVHCHYGFNRTGFFIACYLIERANYGVQQAIDDFQAKRPPGIRHEHFLNTLFVRYCVGLAEASNL